MAKTYLPFICILGLFFNSCYPPHTTDFNSLISEADKAILYKYSEDSQSQPIIRIAELQKQDIRIFKHFLSDHISPNQGCGYDGTIFFYKEGKKLFNLRFANQNNCSYATYLSNDKLIEADLSFVGARYLQKAMIHSGLAHAEH